MRSNTSCSSLTRATDLLQIPKYSCLDMLTLLRKSLHFIFVKHPQRLFQNFLEFSLRWIDIISLVLCCQVDDFFHPHVAEPIIESLDVVVRHIRAPVVHGMGLLRACALEAVDGCCWVPSVRPGLCR